MSQLQTPPCLTLSGKAEATEKALCAAAAPAKRKSDETFSSSRSASVDASGSAARGTSVAFGKHGEERGPGFGFVSNGAMPGENANWGTSFFRRGVNTVPLSCCGLTASETRPPERGCHGAREAEQFSAAAVWTAEENTRAALGQ